MDRFKGILICSDLDGTFCGSEETVSANKKAIEYFIKGGGRFTFATGRNISHLLNSNLCDIINAPACLLNGSIIYDYKQEKILYKKELGFSLKDFIEKISEYSNGDITLCVYSGCDGSDVSTVSLKNVTDDIADVTPLKIVCCFSNSQQADQFKSFALKEKLFKDCYISKSWSVGVEFNSSHATKGTAINFIKNHLKDIHTCIGVGDYENDIPMLLKADIGICVGNGIDDVKKVADYVTVSNEKCAIEKIIDDIDKGILKI